MLCAMQNAKNSIAINVNGASPRRAGKRGWQLSEGEKKSPCCVWTNGQVVFFRKALKETMSRGEQGGGRPALTFFT